MTISFLTPSRSVLLIGDEALYIYNVTFNAAKLVNAVPWQADDFTDSVVNAIRKDCGGKPILILNDMTDQPFKGGQRMPNVGVMDKANVIQRKLQVAFPNYPIRGALPVKQFVPSRSGKGGRIAPTGLYLFAAVPMSEAIQKTIDAAKKSMTSISGFYLLPIESSDMVRALSERLAGKSRPVSRWVVFIGQHQNGALRQVITRDGQLAMTRMTPVTDTDTESDSWAAEVSQEFKATISYLSRFGYEPEDGTDVIVVSSPAAGDALEKLIEIPCHYTSFTVTEAARILGMKIGMQDNPHHADALHVAWTGRKSRFTLPMKAADIDNVVRPRKIAAFVMALFILSGAFFSWQVAGQFQTLLETKDDLTLQGHALVQAKTDYAQELARMEALGFDVNLIQGALGAYEEFESERVKTLPLIVKIAEALGNELRLDALSIKYIDNKGAAAAGVFNPVGNIKKQGVEAALKLSFPPSLDQEFGIREVNNLKRRLVTLLPGYTVSIEQNVAGRDYSNRISGAAGRAAEDIAAEEYVAELLIRGDVQ